MTTEQEQPTAIHGPRGVALLVAESAAVRKAFTGCSCRGSGIHIDDGRWVWCRCRDGHPMIQRHER